MKREWSAAAVSVLAFSATAVVFAAIRRCCAGGLDQGFSVAVFLYYVALFGCAASLLLVAIAKRLVTYRVAQLLRLVCTLGAVRYAAGNDPVVFALVISVVVEFGMFEAYPGNLAASGTLVAAAVAAGVAVASAAGGGLGEAFTSQIPLLVSGFAACLLGSRLILFRESVIDVQKQNELLENLVVQLSRANTQYQDYAVLADESGREQERRRITRDIHDIVGYTLTNNIMLMETAIDMMRENPLGVPSVIELARTNAEEGLGRIRQALYDLRRKEGAYPVGIRAIHRLVRIFREATGVTVVCEFGNLPMTISEGVDSTLYHLVQEGLINSFRHGKADRITILMWRGDGTISVKIRDNGMGAQTVVEGIGLKGMRERIERLEGDLSTRSSADGFVLSAVIPYDGSGMHEKDNAVYR